MTESEIKKAVAEQLVGMIDCDVIKGGGTEDFVGWCEDGEVFFNNGMVGEDIERAMKYVREINDSVYGIVQKLAWR